jgi:hypothetical protein
VAKQTPNLGLILPANGEYTGNWDVPVNQNFQKLDTAVGANTDELESAAGSASDLTARLAVSMNPDGTLIPTAEVLNARSSPVYGLVDDYSGNPALGPRINMVDFEVFAGRSGGATLVDGMAQLSSDGQASNCIVSAPSGFLTATGAVVSLNGSVTPVLANINGYRAITRSVLTSTVSGSAGTYYVTLTRNPGGYTYLTSIANQGATSVNPGNNELQYFTDTTQNFVTLGVQAGDVISITSAGSENIGNYVIAGVVNATTLLIAGVFLEVQSGLNYNLIAPYQPTLGITSTPNPLRYVPGSTSGVIYIGQAIFDGTNVTSIIPYAVKGVFEQFFPIALVSGNFNQTIQHNLGFVPSKLLFYGSQSNDYSGNINPLVIDQNSTSARAVIADMTSTQLRVRNAQSGLFYTDFDGTNQITGYLLVRAER